MLQAPTEFKIKDMLEQSEYFKTIGNIDEFTHLLYITYGQRVDICHQIGKMNLWAFANPDRHKKNWKRFIVNWMSKY